MRRLATAAILAVFAGTMPSAQVPIPIDPEAGPFPWAIPLDGGPIDVLLAAPLYTLGDAAHLSKFMDVDLDVQAWDAELDEDGAAFAVDDAARLEALSTSADVYVFAHLGASPPSESIRSRIDSLRAEGTGFVLIRYGDDAAAWLEALTEDAAPLESSACAALGISGGPAPDEAGSMPIVGLHEDADGSRIADIAWPAPAPESHSLIPLAGGIPQLAEAQLPSLLSPVAKAVRWAGHREPKVRIESIEQPPARGPAEAEVPPFLPREFIEHSRGALGTTVMEPVIVHLDRPAPSRMEVRFQLRYPDRGTVGLARGTVQRALPKGAAFYELQIPAGPGRVLVDVWIVERGRVVDWNTAAVEIRAWPALEEPRCNATALERNGEIRLAATVQPNINRPRPATLYARATDALGRRVAEQYLAVPETGGEVSMALRLTDLISTEVLVELFACDQDGGKVSPWVLERSAYAAFLLPVRQPAGADYIFVAQGLAGYEPNARATNRALRALGADTLAALPGTHSDLGGAADGLHPIARLAAFDDPNSNGVACLANPSMLREQRFSVADVAGAFASHGAGLYSLGDGSRIAPDHEARCDSPDCDEAFRRQLEAGYPALEALNAAWGSTFGSWRDIDFAGAPESSLAARVDRRQYLTKIFCEALVQTGTMLRGVEMGAFAGFAAVRRPDAVAGYDWAGLVPGLGMISLPAGSTAIAKVRSYAGPGAFHSVLLDGAFAGAAEGNSRWAAWNAAVEGLRGIRIDGAYGSAGHVPAFPGLSETGKPAGWFSEAATAVAAIRSGFGFVLSHARRTEPEIAILDSYSSHVLNEIDHEFGCTSTEAESAFAAWLDVLGFRYDYVPEKRLGSNGLDGFKVVILPSARALGDVAVAALLEFEARGGALLADVAPAQFDEHGCLRPYPSLAPAFGIRHRRPIEAGAAVDLGGIQAVPDISVVADTGVPDRSAGDVPLWIRHGGDKGRALLLNFTVNLGPPPEELDDALRAWLMDSGAQPAAADFLDEWGAPDAKCSRFDYGAAHIAAFTRRPDVGKRSERLNVRPAHGRFAYDMREGLPLGPGRRHSWPLERGEPVLISSLPYEVSRVTIEAPSAVMAGRRLSIHVGVKSRKSLPGTHAVHVSVGPRFGPALAHYDRTVECPGGQGELYIPLALNEAAGGYVLTARDVLTGIASTHAFDILPPV